LNKNEGKREISSDVKKEKKLNIESIGKTNVIEKFLFVEHEFCSKIPNTRITGLILNALSY
jgi:hypothetical protein